MTEINSKYSIGDEVLWMIGDRIFKFEITDITIVSGQFVNYVLYNEEAEKYRWNYNKSAWQEDRIGEVQILEKGIVMYQEVLKKYPLNEDLPKGTGTKIRMEVYKN